MDVQIVNPVSFPEWSSLLASMEGYSFFHSSQWAKVLSGSYRYRPVYFVSFEKDRPVALIPFMDVKSLLTGHRGVSLPFTDFCEPLLSCNSDFHDIFKQIVAYGKEAGWSTLELRGGADLLGDALPYATYLSHFLDLSPDEDYCFSRFKDSTRRNIRKALAGEIEIKILNSLESIREFYRLNCLTRKRHGLPPQPYHFFKSLHDEIISENCGLVVMAYHKDTAIAGAVYFHLGDKAIYKYGASDRKYQLLRANNLVMWGAIKWYCNNGYKGLSFGRTERNNPGLRRFKSSWGTREQMIHYYKYDVKRDAFLRARGKGPPFYVEIFKKTPVPLLKMIGSLLYRHVA
jgi:hypothetical protein